MDTLAQDLRQAFRALRKSPGFTLIAVLTLALGMGANSAIFSVVNAVLLRPLPMKDADALVRIESVDARRGPKPSSAPDFRDIRAQNRSFTDMTAVNATELSLTGAGGEPERLQGAQVTAAFFEVMGVQAQLGRTFQSEEDQPGKSKVVVLGQSLWKRRYGADPGILGRTISLGGEPHTVVGVVRADFDFPSKAQLWVPLTWEGDLVNPENRGSHWLHSYGRLKPGVTLQQANADIVAVARGLEEQYPDMNAGKSGRVRTLREELVGDVEPALLVLLGAVGLVMLIACANLSNLLLARAVGREGEISVRLALGASRGHIIRQLLVESVVLAVAGAGLGLLLAGWGLDVLVAVGPADIPRLDAVSLDGPVLAFTSGLAVLTALLFGLLPALQASRTELSRSLREIGKGGGTGARNRTRNLLVVGETALAVVLLVSAGLLLKSFVRLQQVDPGFRADHLLTFDLELPETVHKSGSPGVQQVYDTLFERLRGLPGVKRAGGAMFLPMAGSMFRSSIRDMSRPEPEPGKADLALVHIITPGYMEAMRIPLKRGRLLTAQDGIAEGTRAVLISEEAARKYWPNEDPLGRTVEVGIDFGNGEFGGTVVGVVGSVRYLGMTREPFPEVYVPYPQARGSTMAFVLQTEGEPLALAADVRREVRAPDASLPVANLRTMESFLGDAVAQPRFYMMLVAVFAALALTLAAIGIYGVVTHAVSHRTRELGIRMALGADGRSVVRLVMAQYLRLTGLGLGVGLLLAFAASRLLQGMLHGVEGSDPLTYAGVAGVLGGVALLASFLPAHRATRIDPIVALRYE
ncbi:MAG: ABC transporter permease [Myxococcaceae bacterium]|nr:ABC transporter permease [Myxococcaceae bacterium]